MTKQAITKQYIHHTAIIDKAAIIHPGAKIGPFCIIEGNVEIGPDTVIDSHVAILADPKKKITVENGSHLQAHSCIKGNVYIGAHTTVEPFALISGDVQAGSQNHFGAHCAIGGVNQDRKHQGPALKTIIGDNNRFFEGVVVHCGSSGDKGVTRVGSRCHVMDGAHIAHDCVVQDDVTIGNDVNLGGHVTVESFAWVGAGTGVHQFCQIGRFVFVAGYARVVHDIPPFVMFLDEIGTVNVVGLKRHDFAKSEIVNLNKTVKYLFQSDDETLFAERLSTVTNNINSESVRELVDFISASQENVGRRGCYTRMAKKAP